jgi:hypothetical protein
MQEPADEKTSVRCYMSGCREPTDPALWFDVDLRDGKEPIRISA